MKMCARLLLLLACLALCRGHAVVPVSVVPAAHTYHGLVAAPYPLIHHASYHGLGHELLAGPLGRGLLGHHLWKRSPHYVAPLAYVAPVAHVAPIAPVAVSHQARLDVHTSPAIVSPVVPVPLIHKAVVGPLHYGAGLHGGFYPHAGHY